ncbi:MAG: phage terminase small subunit P27 family [Actinomycetota bacterium]
MGRRGPTRKTAKPKSAGGNASKRTGRKPNAPVGDAPEPPDWLDAEAKAEWERTVEDLRATGTLQRVDRVALVTYCQAWSNLVESTTTLRDEGATYTTDSGYCGKHPACTIQKESMQTLIAFAREFGLTPMARIRMEIDLGGRRDGGSTIGDYADAKGGA